ncbi:tryptophan 7-halogenase [Sphingomonas sp. MMS12-HWE2-04]|uniref:tryptophan 7-halogenase n=1 Tax=Sphingomonas sp. MMS12-HWE2-04 TaxID=3234199 RepID=UPI00384D3CCD
MSRAIRSVAVLGGGIVALSAAAAFARALPGVAVTLIETPVDPAALADRLPGSTSAIHRFHAAIGIEEAALIRSGAALPRLGLRFENWPGEAWVHVHGDHGVPESNPPFHQLWARARQAGQAEAYHLYAAAGVIAEAGKFVHPQSRPPLSGFDYALRLDLERCRAALAAHGDRLGVRRSGGRLAGIERRDDVGIAALRLDDGRRVEADLFVDAAGPAALLLSALDPAFEDWALPFDRLSFDAATGGALDPNDTLTASETGWQWRAPFPDRTLAGSVGTGEIALRAGRRPRPWIGNVLAIGDAAVALDPLHWLPLHLAHSAILRALDLLPGRDCAPIELAEYNRRAAAEDACAHDFVAVHYRRWGVALPPVLEQFCSRGRFVARDEDGLDRETWLAALFGLGLLPRAIDPLAAAVPEQAAVAGLRRFAEGLAGIPAQLPPFGEYLARR